MHKLACINKTGYLPALLMVFMPVINMVMTTVAADTGSPPLIQATLMHYAAQKNLYNEGEGESNDESLFLPWEQYAVLGGVIGLALGIVWLAEEPPSPCMVATAAYGTPLSPEITFLRQFRDQILLNTVLGTAFVDLYYHAGWGVAKFVGAHDWAARMVRAALVPALFVAAAAVAFPETAIALGHLFLATATLLVLYWALRTWGLRKQDVQAHRNQKRKSRS